MVTSEAIMKVKDTSLDYETMLDYTAEENIISNLDEFLGEESDKDLKVAPAKVNKEFPESWQTITMNFPTEEDYVEFMLKADEKPMPKLNKFVYKAGRTDTGLLGFLED